MILSFSVMTSPEPGCAGGNTCRSRGHHHGETCALAWLAVDVEQAPQFVHSFAHALQAEVRTRSRPIAGFQSLSVVGHGEVGTVGGKPQLDVDVCGAAVFERVGQRLEADTKEMMLLGG